MLPINNKKTQLSFVPILSKKHKLNVHHSKLLHDVVSILKSCKNNYNHYDIDMIEHFFAYPIVLDQQIHIYENNELKAFISYAFLNKEVEKSWLTLNQKIKLDEWNCGNSIWIIDALSPWGHGRAATTKLEDHLTKLGHKGKIIRYKRNYPNGKTRFNQSII